jgi:hypothetical protein
MNNQKEKLTVIQILENLQNKYKNYKEGEINLSDECIEVIKCPKSFKIDSFIELKTKPNQ